VGRILAVVVALVVLVFVALPTLILPFVAPDATAPSAVGRLLPDAKRALASNLDSALAYVRYLGVETRQRDQLVVLQFEIRPWPYVFADRAYLASRCTPIANLDPRAMSGGRGVSDWATDPELTYLRSDAQEPCR
jgi:hypothetical protein